jgi:hypothetical protein
LKEIELGSTISLSKVMIEQDEIKLLLHSVVKVLTKKPIDVKGLFGKIKPVPLGQACQSDSFHLTVPLRCTKLWPRSNDPVWNCCSFCFAKDPCFACKEMPLTVNCAFAGTVTDDVSYETTLYFNAIQVATLLDKKLIELQTLIADSESLAHVASELNPKRTFVLIVSRRKASKYVNIEAIRLTE